MTTRPSGVRRAGLVVVGLLLVPPAPEADRASATYPLVAQLADPAKQRREEARDRLVADGDRALLWPVADALFFVPKPLRAEALSVLSGLSGKNLGERYLDWLQWLATQPEIQSPPGYATWKGEQLARIDGRYRTVLYPGAPTRIRFEEIVFGGVPLEGIPAWDHPVAVSAEAARFLRDDDRIFGVVLEGEAKAYALKVMSWHEMANDTVGGRPVTLSYCTLCGSAILFDTRTPRGTPYEFGTSGLLYRSNKLMVDRGTLSLWSNLTGEPVVGRLARSPIQLPVLPLTLTTWSDWRTRHPATKVAQPDFALASRLGFDYREGAAERARKGVRFPRGPAAGGVSALDDADEIFAVRLQGSAKVYPIDLLMKQTLLADRLGDTALVLLTDSTTGAIAAYAAGDEVFRREAREPRILIDAEGRPWRVEEDGLHGPAAQSHPRLPGHRAFWFGWRSFFPDSAVYSTPK